MGSSLTYRVADRQKFKEFKRPHRTREGDRARRHPSADARRRPFRVVHRLHELNSTCRAVLPSRCMGSSLSSRIGRRKGTHETRRGQRALHSAVVADDGDVQLRDVPQGLKRQKLVDCDSPTGVSVRGGPGDPGRARARTLHQARRGGGDPRTRTRRTCPRRRCSPPAEPVVGLSARAGRLLDCPTPAGVSLLPGRGSPTTRPGRWRHRGAARPEV